MPTISQYTNPVAAVFFAVLGGVFRLKQDRRDPKWAEVVDDFENVIGSAHQFYSNGGWAVHTGPFAGYVRADQVEFV